MHKENTKTKVCPTCRSSFSYETGKGMDRKHCSRSCRVRNQITRRKERHEALPSCSVDGCEGKATRISYGMCETHYYRMRRTGTTDPRPATGRYKTGPGYIKLLMPDHPLSDKQGTVFEHRLVAYEKYNGQCPNCFWCGVPLTWGRSVVDHLNEIKADNTKDNLVVSCNKCNRARGAMVPLVRRLRPEVFQLFIECIGVMREKAL